MAVDYSKYPATGEFSTNLKIYYRTALDIYNAVGGFGGKVEKGISLSWTNYHLSGGTFYFPNVEDVTQSYAYSFNFRPSLFRNNKVYNVLTSCQTETTLKDNAIQGYNRADFVYPEITANTRYTLRGTAVRYLSDYQPSRFFQYIYSYNQTWGLDDEYQDFALAWLNMDNISSAHWWSYSFHDVLSRSIVGINTATSVTLYDDIEAVLSRNLKFTRMIDNNYTHSIFCRNWSRELFTIVFNMYDGIIQEVRMPTGYNPVFQWYNAQYYVFGNIPVVDNLNVQEALYDFYGDISYGGKSFIYFDGVPYKVENGKLVDALGRELAGDVEKGALFIYVEGHTDTQLIISVRCCHHVKSILKALCSCGLPVRTTQDYTASNPLNSINPQYEGVSQYYQTKINIRTGEVKGEPQPLYIPENAQLITNPNGIEIPYSDNITITETPLKVPEVFYISKGVRTYAMGQGDFNTLMQRLYELPADIFEIVKGFSENISESIRNVTVFPFHIPNNFLTASTNLVYYGEELLPSVNEVRRNNCIIDMGSFSVQGEGNFMDYEPYTQYFISLPYVGIRKLDSRDVVGKNINVKYIVDVQTGECRANVFRDGVLLSTHNGICGITIPIVSRDYATIISNINNIISSTASLTESPFNANNTITSLFSAVSSANIYRSSVTENGESGTTSSFTLPQYPYIIEIRSRYEIPENYGHSVGYVCEESGRIVDYTGFTICDNVDCSGIPCLEEEREAIRNILESGIYL